MNLKDLFDNKENWKLIPKVSGIYAIHNKITDGVYIGSAKNLRQRLRSHSKCLRHNKHQNPHLQNSFNKHGIKVFSFQILELCEAENLIKYEQTWLDIRFGNNCYNICPNARSPLNTKKSQNFIDNLAKEFRVIYPNGKEEIRKNLHQFCKLHNLDNRTAHHVMKGRQYKHKGFRFFPVDENKLAITMNKLAKLKEEVNHKTAKVFDPEGNIIYLEPSKIRQFELANNLNKASISAICNQSNYYCIYRGWTGYYCDEQGVILPSVALNRLKNIIKEYKTNVYKELDSSLYEITTLENTKIYSKNLKIFCELYDCNYNTIIGCLNNKFKSFNKGWKISKVE